MGAVVAIAKVELPDPATWDGENEQEDFAGNPEHASATEPLKLPNA